jgi:Mg-chelatase subunit ChlD
MSRQTQNKSTSFVFSTKFISNYVERFELFSRNVIAVNIESILKGSENERFKVVDMRKKMECMKCGALFSKLSEKVAKLWECEYCGEKIRGLTFNDSELCEEAVEYRRCEQLGQQPAAASIAAATPPRIVCLCLDVSGSMEGYKLECIKKSCFKLLDQLVAVKPHYKVALLSFSSHGVYFGDGGSSSSESLALLSYDSQLVQLIKEKASKLSSIKESQSRLRNQINALRSGGSTFVGDALKYSCFLASAVANSCVYVSTDGAAEDGTEALYRPLIDYCKRSDAMVRVFVISFKEDNCNLALLGRVASETGGKIYQISNETEFDAAFDDTLLKSNEQLLDATLSVKLLSLRNFVSINGAGHALTLTGAECANKRELLFEYSFKYRGHYTRHFVPFQLQVSYESGSKLKCVSCGMLYYGDRGSAQYAPPLLNEPIVHSYAMRKFAKLLLGSQSDRNEAKKLLNEYKTFCEQEASSCGQGNELTSIFGSMDLTTLALDDCKSKLIYNMTSINTNEIAMEKSAVGNSQNVLSMQVMC